MELAEHVRLTIEANLPVYFCDPHNPWQRGTNENSNGLLRQDFLRAPTSPPTPPSGCSRSQPR